MMEGTYLSTFFFLEKFFWNNDCEGKIMSKIVKGIEASPGIAIGKIFLYQENELVIDEKMKCDSDCEKERLLSGREKCKRNNY